MSGGAEALETAAGPEQATEEASLIMVLAAKRELRSGSFLRDSDLELIPLPEGAPERRYFSQEAGEVDQETGAVEQATSAVEQLRGALVTATIPAGAPLEADMIIGTTEQGFLTAALAPGMRAVSVAINDVTGLSGFASPGDRVDVVLTYTVLHTEFEQKERTWSETILQNVRLLSITQRVDPATGMPTVGVGHTATMELYPSQVEVLSLAATYGVVSLSLHGPPSDTEPTFGFSYTSDLGVAAGISDFFESGRAVGTAENVATDTPAFTRKAIQVLVAKRALAEGALLKDSDFHFEVLAGDIPAGADYFVMGVVKVETLRGALVTTAIGANEIIPADALMKPAEQGFLAAAIKPGMRASSIRIDQTTGVSGFISPGDVVDVLMTHSVVDISDEPIYSPRRFAETVVSGARVIAVETVTDPVRNRDDWKSAASPQWRKTVTLETTAKQAEVLVLAGSLGSLSFALHSSAPGAVETEETVETSFTSDWEISDSLLSFSLESEPMYRVKHPEILTDPPFEIDWPRELLFPPGLLTDWPPGTLGPAEQQPPTTAAAPAAPAAPIAPTTGGDTGGSIKVFRSSNESTVNVGQ